MNEYGGHAEIEHNTTLLFESSTVVLECSFNNYTAPNTSCGLNTTCTALPPTTQGDDGDDTYGLTFWLLITFNIVYACTQAPVQPLIDATIIHVLGMS